MTQTEYDVLQERLTEHLVTKKRTSQMVVRERDAYERAVLACKSVLNQFYLFHKEVDEE